MKKLFGIAVLAAAIMALPLLTQAADKAAEPPAKTEKKAKAIASRGNVASVDKVAKTVTLEGKEKTRTFQITSETKIHDKDKKPATLDQVVVGDHVGLSYRETPDGKMELVTLNILAKPAKAK